MRVWMVLLLAGNNGWVSTRCKRCILFWTVFAAATAANAEMGYILLCVSGLTLLICTVKSGKTVSLRSLKGKRKSNQI